MAIFKKKPKINRELRFWAAGMFAVMVAVNALANILPINGITSGGVSDSYPNLFAPAGFTFAIWGVIYLVLGAYTFFQLGFFQEKKTSLDAGQINDISKYFLISSILNAAWIFLWHYDFIGLSVLAIAGILYCLISIANILRKATLTNREQLLVRIPFSIYFGWITIATIANITTWLTSIGWDGWGRADEFWAVAILIVGALIGLVRMRYDSDAIYGLVFVWAFYGILMKHLSETAWDGQYPAVVGALAALLTVLILEIAVIAKNSSIDLTKRI